MNTTLIRVRLLDMGGMGKTAFIKNVGKNYVTKDEKYILNFTDDCMNHFNEENADVAMILFDNSEPDDTLPDAKNIMTRGYLPKILCGSKLDISDVLENLTYFPYSVITNEGIPEILNAIVRIYEETYKNIKENPYISQPSFVTEA